MRDPALSIAVLLLALIALVLTACVGASGDQSGAPSASISSTPPSSPVPGAAAAPTARPASSPDHAAAAQPAPTPIDLRFGVFRQPPGFVADPNVGKHDVVCPGHDPCGP